MLMNDTPSNTRQPKPAAPRYTVVRPSLVQSIIAPVTTRKADDHTLFVDFGQAMFGTLRLTVSSEQASSIVIHLGEKANEQGRLDRQPPGTVRYLRVELAVKSGTHEYQLTIPADKRNTGPLAIHMPAHIGEVYPFRYVEIEAGQCKVDVASVRMIAVHVPFDDDAAHFECNDDVLNAVWKMCKHTIKATSFAGVYVDGDRERIPYEGDAYINQLCHYCADASYDMARYSHEYLIQHPTWFTDWILHSVLMAWADYQYTGNADSLVCFYEDLKAKTLIDLAGEDGIISTFSELRTKEFEARLHLDGEQYAKMKVMNDLVDWPPGSFTQGGIGERDNHEMLPVNSVVNALHYRTLIIMESIARVVGNVVDCVAFQTQAIKLHKTFNRGFFDEARGVYIDGEGSSHASLHANSFALAMGLVPAHRKASVIAFIKSRGMACSVYGAQHLLEGLYDAGQGDYALSLMNATHDRSWFHMIEQGSTVALEAWAHKYKNNLDWNHAWGAAPGNIIPRKLMGVEPAQAGFAAVSIKPQPAGLQYAKIKTPTPQGPIEMVWENSANKKARLVITRPGQIKLKLDMTHIAYADVIDNNKSVW